MGYATSDVEEAFEMIEAQLCGPAVDNAYNQAFNQSWAETGMSAVDGAGLLLGPDSLMRVYSVQRRCFLQARHSHSVSVTLTRPLLLSLCFYLAFTLSLSLSHSHSHSVTLAPNLSISG